MKYTILTLLFTLFLFSAAASAQTAPAPKPTPAPAAKPADISGKWTVMADAQGTTIQIAVELKQTGDTFTGSTASDMGNGIIDGGMVSGKAFIATLHADVQGNPMDFRMDGTADGDKITGTFTNAQLGSIPFTATKNK